MKTSIRLVGSGVYAVGRGADRFDCDMRLKRRGVLSGWDFIISDWDSGTSWHFDTFRAAQWWLDSDEGQALLDRLRVGP